MKIIVCLFGIIAVVSAAVKEPRLKNYIDECQDPGENNHWTPYYSGSEYASGKFLQIVTREFKWPQTSEYRGIIRCIRVSDLKADGTGGYPVIERNGVNFHDVLIKMKSQRSHGFEFRIEILGDPAVPNLK